MLLGEAPSCYSVEVAAAQREIGLILYSDPIAAYFVSSETNETVINNT